MARLGYGCAALNTAFNSTAAITVVHNICYKRISRSEGEGAFKELFSITNSKRMLPCMVKESSILPNWERASWKLQDVSYSNNWIPTTMCLNQPLLICQISFTVWVGEVFVRFWSNFISFFMIETNPFGWAIGLQSNDIFVRAMI